MGRQSLRGAAPVFPRDQRGTNWRDDRARRISESAIALSISGKRFSKGPQAGRHAAARQTRKRPMAGLDRA
jgi:hypothetical protein